MFSHEYTLQERISDFMYAVYGFMAAALVITGVIAYVVGNSPAIAIGIVRNPILFFGIIIAQLALVVSISGWVQRMSFTTALALFFLYAASLGLTLSVIFLVYTAASIYQTFAVSAGMFGVMAVYGYVTRTDLTRIGSMVTMMLFGLIIAVVVNIFLKSEAFQTIISFVGVIVFTLLTAYDTQKLKMIGREAVADRETMGKIAVVGALTLYLDFVNLFLFLLRFMGKRRN